MIQRAVLLVVLGAAACCCSGCATMPGGIIGHQSGECAAGLAARQIYAWIEKDVEIRHKS